MISNWQAKLLGRAVLELVTLYDNGKAKWREAEAKKLKLPASQIEGPDLNELRRKKSKPPVVKTTEEQLAELKETVRKLEERLDP